MRIKGPGEPPAVATDRRGTSYIHFTLQHKPRTANPPIGRRGFAGVTSDHLPKLGNAWSRAQNRRWDEVTEFEFRATFVYSWLGNHRDLAQRAAAFSRVHCFRGPRLTVRLLRRRR